MLTFQWLKRQHRFRVHSCIFSSLHSNPKIMWHPEHSIVLIIIDYEPYDPQHCGPEYYCILSPQLSNLLAQTTEKIIRFAPSKQHFGRSFKKKKISHLVVCQAEGTRLNCIDQFFCVNNVPSISSIFSSVSSHYRQRFYIEEVRKSRVP